VYVSVSTTGRTKYEKKRIAKKRHELTVKNRTAVLAHNPVRILNKFPAIFIDI
jgi:hypothetical protein